MRPTPVVWRGLQITVLGDWAIALAFDSVVLRTDDRLPDRPYTSHASRMLIAFAFSDPYLAPLCDSRLGPDPVMNVAV